MCSRAVKPHMRRKLKAHATCWADMTNLSEISGCSWADNLQLSWQLHIGQLIAAEPTKCSWVELTYSSWAELKYHSRSKVVVAVSQHEWWPNEVTFVCVAHVLHMSTCMWDQMHGKTSRPNRFISSWHQFERWPNIVCVDQNRFEKLNRFWKKMCFSRIGRFKMSMLLASLVKVDHTVVTLHRSKPSIVSIIVSLSQPNERVRPREIVTP